MKISACYIVKNEAANLPRSLASLGDAWDELVVVDTGSTDETVAIATRAGARVLHYTWQDDFAAARNFALDHATGDWVIFLDADEYFARPLVRAELTAWLAQPPQPQELRLLHNYQSPASVRTVGTDVATPVATGGAASLMTSQETSGAAAEKLTAQPAAGAGETVVDVVLVVLENLERGEQAGQGTLTPGCPRILRRDLALRYRGRIHEQPCYVGQPPRPLCLRYAPDTLRLLHTGYAQVLSPAKSRRNLHILQAEIAAHGLQPGYHYYLADCYQGLGDYAAAAREAAAGIAEDTEMLGDGTHLYHVVIESLRHLGGRDAEMLQWAERGIAAFPEQPEFYAEQGMCLCALGRLPEARQALIEALIRYEEDAPRPEGGYFYARQAGQCAARLGEIMTLQGDPAEAATWYGLANHYAPHDPHVQAKIRRWRERRE